MIYEYDNINIIDINESRLHIGYTSGITLHHGTQYLLVNNVLEEIRVIQFKIH